MPPAAGAEERATKFAAAPPTCNTTTSTYVNNFVVLARNHSYDGIVFQPVIAGFMAQAGVAPRRRTRRPRLPVR